MGADLYIDSVYIQNSEKYKPLFVAACALRDSKHEIIRLLQGDILLNYLKTTEGEKLLNDKKIESRPILDYLLDPNKNPLPETDQTLVELFYEEMGNKGYFRDSYNATSLFGLLGLSWWQDVAPKLTKGGYLPLEHVRWLIDEVSQRPFSLPTIDELRADHARCEDEKELKGWHDYFLQKKERLLAFLNQCLLLGEEPRMSL